ncbi:hypothetical protein SAMN04489844_0250 [Nocardioides exalbidus]|uniref:Uncharacterized protein n=1 Tax=Nocardioides exalbidus TaxID=402596 RepID=A0A1H4JQA0_9ACTN|nr:hypothetical protein [Nocardioides exalbidus]SEB48490.1 hypothetical protein SAMN04489844_0250 [Nocardioides exalbidus]
MSTNKLSPAGRRVTDLPEVKRRRRLENLLYTRKPVAHLVAEYRSHGLDEHIELYFLQLEVEQVLADEFPDAYEDHVGDWDDEEVGAEHHPMVTAATCSLCHAIALHNGGDSGSPLAA